MDGSENISIIASWTGPKLDKPQPRSSRNRMRQEVKSQPNRRVARGARGGFPALLRIMFPM